MKGLHEKHTLYLILGVYEFKKHFYESNGILPIQPIMYLMLCQIINKLYVSLIFLRWKNKFNGKKEDIGQGRNINSLD